MRDRPERAAALDRRAAQEPSLAKAQAIAQDADRLRRIAGYGLPRPGMAFQLFRN